MKRTMMATALSTALLFTGTLKAAKADLPRPDGHERSMAGKSAGARMPSHRMVEQPTRQMIGDRNRQR
jgi:hypothetical protein